VIPLTDEQQLQMLIHSTKMKLFELVAADKQSREKRNRLTQYLYILWGYENELMGQKKLSSSILRTPTTSSKIL
jgi:hypothetical protein